MRNMVVSGRRTEPGVASNCSGFGLEETFRKIMILLEAKQVTKVTSQCWKSGFGERVL